MKADKDLYRELRVLSCETLWQKEVPRFDRASPKERVERVALIRAIGVVFAASGSAQQKGEVKTWLIRLLQDPSEKIRRYAMAALPKINAGPKAEGELLSLLQTAKDEREKKFVGRALDKVGGSATLDVVAGTLPQTEQKVRAKVARQETPSTIRMDAAFSDFKRLRIHLRCRRGLEEIVRDEAEEYFATHGKFRVLEMSKRFVAISPIAPFSLNDIYALRCFGSVGFALGTIKKASPEETVEALAKIITSRLSQNLFTAFTEGSLRYRLNFVSKGHQRGAVHVLANRAYEMCPDILNDPRSAPWSMDIFPFGQGQSVELRPRLTPDPRFYYRKDDVDAASHPPLAACMARLAGRIEDEIIWDPFCGSGLELIESTLLGHVQRIYGTDLSPEAIAIAQTNFTAANVQKIEAKFICCDFRDADLGPESVTLIISNPPMGRRIRIPDMQALFTDFFNVAAKTLKPNGRLVFVNPLKLEPHNKALTLQHRQVVDLGGYDARLEVYLKS